MTTLTHITDQSAISRIESIKDNYTSQVAHFCRWIRERGLGVDEESIRDYFQWLNDESGYAANTVRGKRQAVKKRVRQLFHTAPIEERVKIDRVLSDLDHDGDTKAPSVNAQSVTSDKVLSPMEFRSLLEKCRSVRQRAFLRFLWETGCRVSEMLSVTLDRCDVGDAVVTIRVTGKGRKERFVRIRRQLFEEIQAAFNGQRWLFETAGGQPYRRQYVGAQIAKLGKRIGRRMSPHSLRHSWATRMVEQHPGKIGAVSRYLGHSSPSITLEMYVHDSLTDAELFDVEVAS